MDNEKKEWEKRCGENDKTTRQKKQINVYNDHTDKLVADSSAVQMN